MGFVLIFCYIFVSLYSTQTCRTYFPGCTSYRSGLFEHKNGMSFSPPPPNVFTYLTVILLYFNKACTCRFSPNFFSNLGEIRYTILWRDPHAVLPPTVIFQTFYKLLVVTTAFWRNQFWLYLVQQMLCSKTEKVIEWSIKASMSQSRRTNKQQQKLSR